MADRCAWRKEATVSKNRFDAIPVLALSAESSGPSPSPSKTPANPATAAAAAMDDAIPVLAHSAASSGPSPSQSKTPATAAAAARDDAIPVSTRLHRTTPYHDAYTVDVYDKQFEARVTAQPADARRWVDDTTRWLHGQKHPIVGLGVQWTPTCRLGETPVPATLQLSVGDSCLVFHLARADAVPEELHRFLADPRVTFVGRGSAYDCRMLREHYDLHVARGRELRAMAGMRNASVEQMADRFLGYPGICKPRDVAMSAWHAPRLSLHQVQYASVDAYLAFRLGRLLTESEMDSYDDVYRTATRGLPVRAYASDSDYSVYSSDGFEDVRSKAFTDEEDEEDDGSYTGPGSLGADDIDGNGDDDEEDEEGCDEDDQDDDNEGDSNEGDQSDEEGCNEDDLEDEEGCNQDEENVEDGCKQGNEEGYTDEDQNDEEGYSEDDQEVDYGFDQDDEHEFEEFYLL